MRYFNGLINCFTLILMLTIASPSLHAAADDGRTGQDFSDLLFSSRNLLEDFDMAKARGMCGAREALNAVHILFKTRATAYAGSGQDPAETRSWSTIAGTPTSITLDWTPYSSKSSAGVIMVRATVENDCTGKSPRDLKWASIRINIPVNIGRDNKFHASAPKEIHIDTVCCGSQRITRTALFTPTGQIIRAEGTIYPPSTPVSISPAKPSSGGNMQPASTSQGSSSSTTYTPPPKPVIDTQPKPKPEPWTMENPCPECEDEKAIVEHHQKRIILLKDEKTKQEGKLKSTTTEINDLEKKIKALEDRLEGQKGTGAGALDPSTGIRTTAYDQGDGTVLVKRIYPDGREEIIDRYTRRSLADIKRDLTAKKRELERLKATKTRLEKRISDLSAEISKSEGLLKDAIAAFKACLEYCNRQQGITSAGVTGVNITPGGTGVPETADPGGEKTPGQTDTTGSSNTSPGTTTDGVAPQTADGISSAVEEAVKAAVEAAESVPSESGDTQVPIGYKYDTGLDWQLKYNWLSGYTYFNKDGNIGYDFEIKPTEGRIDGSGISPPQGGYYFTPSMPETEWKVELKYELKDTYNISGIPFTYDTDALQATPQTSAPGFTGLKPTYSSYVYRAFRLLDDGAPATEVGRLIGAHFRDKITFGPPWYLAALEAIDILDEYDEYDQDIYPHEFGIAAAQAVLAAGGSPRDASIMGARATFFAGGTRADFSRVRLSIIDSGYPLRIGTDKLISWNDPEAVPQIISSYVRPKTKFSLQLLLEHPPKEYHGLQQRFSLNRKINFNGSSYNESASEPFNWESITPRIGLNYDIKGDEEDIDMLFQYRGKYFNEKNMSRDPQETTVIPNDPLYQEDSSSLVGSLAKKGFGLVMGALGVGVSTTDHAADYQWGLHAIGLTPRGSSSGWDLYDGSEPNVVVAVIDSGSDLNHPDGPAFLWTNEDEIPGNNIDDDNNGYIDDVHGWNFISESNDIQDDFGHGAFVAGIIAAKTNNSIGIAGVNPGARIMTLKAADNNGKSRSLGIYRAIRYAVDNGARVINISLGKQGLSKLEEIGINYAWNMGCLVVVAAGNQAGIVSEYGPPGSPRAFSVASINVDGKRRGTSNRGRTVAIGAPGEAIYSLSSSTGKHDGQIMPMTNTMYHRLNGTSFAAPYVSGAASLLWGKYPDLSNRQLTSLLISTADDIDEPGWDVRTGAGMLNVRRALETGETPGPGLRITDIRVGREKSNVQWVDLYGVVDGPIESYTIAVAEGSDPDDDEYTEVYGPAATPVDHGLLCRIPASNLEGKKWTFRLSAKLRDGKSKRVTMAFDRDGKILD